MSVTHNRVNDVMIGDGTNTAIPVVSLETIDKGDSVLITEDGTIVATNAIAAANNCAEIQANKLYNQAFRMLDKFIKNNCGCSDEATQITYY